MMVLALHHLLFSLTQSTIVAWRLCWFPALALICSFRSAAEWCLVRFLDLRDGRTAEAAQFVYE